MKKISRKSSPSFYIATSALFIYLGIGHWVRIPPFLGGFLAGISLTGYLWSLYTSKHDLSRIRNWKRNLLSLKNQ